MKVPAITGSILAAAVLAGCGAAPLEEAQANLKEQTQQAVTQAKDAARAEVDQAVAQAKDTVRAEVEGAVQAAIPEEAKALMAGAARFQQMAQDGTWNAEARTYIDQALQSADPAVQLAVVPVIETFQRTVPESRTWLAEHVAPVAEQAKGAAKPIWDGLLADLRAAVPKPATAEAP